MAQVRPERKREIDSYFGREEFFRQLKVMEHSQEVIRELSRHYEIFITTAAMEVPASFRAKYEWLQEHFGFLPDMNFVFCGDKSIIRADYMIDDNVDQFRRFRGQGILFSAPHNAGEQGFVRVDSWLDAGAWLMAKLWDADEAAAEGGLPCSRNA